MSTRLGRFRDSQQLNTDYREYNHWAANNKDLPFTTILGWMQPIPAYIGLVFCIATVFVFATAGWWNGGEKKIDIWAAFVGVSLFLCSQEDRNPRLISSFYSPLVSLYSGSF
jgi:hypothetical protein